MTVLNDRRNDTKRYTKDFVGKIAAKSTGIGMG